MRKNKIYKILKNKNKKCQIKALGIKFVKNKKLRIKNIINP